MKTAMKWLVAAAAIHAVLLLFGGLLLFKKPEARVVAKDVEIVDDAAPKDEKKKEVEPEKKAEAPIEQADQAMPEMKDLAQLESPVNAPALAPLSLADLSGVLDGAGGGGEFGMGGGALSSGGRIGGTGTGVSFDDTMGEVASIADLDQRPRVVFQSPPSYPQELRKRNVVGSVQVVFLVDTAGKVISPKVEKSTNPAFERPALEAVRQWKFEAGTRHGEKVSFKMRVPITFSAS
ncbi:MAG TPA: energy transducer TonB [Candidatus Polarisedimenticolaceae bacterium]|nr:energy transducer TonB [Candidatus Polarisedimenticolaceae bacterium]